MTAGPDSIRKSLTVDASVEHAFRTWYEQIDRWWPKDHSLSKDPKTTIVLEGRVGGRFFERASDGTENDFGSVIVFDPPRRLRYEWYLGASKSKPTEVDVRFTAVADGTRVAIEQRGPDLVGQMWYRHCAGYSRAWDAVLSCFSQTFDDELPQKRKVEQ